MYSPKGRAFHAWLRPQRNGDSSASSEFIDGCAKRASVRPPRTHCTFGGDAKSRDTDQPSAALVKDLKARGLLDDTLVIWGGEFGRAPFLQGNINDRPRWGRDHRPYAFTVWMASGGVKPRISYGASDDLAMNVVEQPVHVHDFQATILHLLGIDHQRFTDRFQGRDFRLTDVHGNVVHEILA